MFYRHAKTISTQNPKSCSLYGSEDWVVFSQEHKRVFFIAKHPQLFRWWRSERHKDDCFNISSDIKLMKLVNQSTTNS